MGKFEVRGTRASKRERQPNGKGRGGGKDGRRERGGEERRGNVTILLPVTHTDVWGGEEEQEEDRGENRGAEKVKETNHL